MTEELTHDQVQDYYGKVLQKSEDLKTNACCTGGRPPEYLLAPLKNIHPEVSDKYYGCGLVAPDDLDGLKILDLGSGSGRDCYLLAQLVGKDGRVCGVDMTQQQLDVATKHLGYHADKFGFANVEFRKGYIEDLRAAGLEDNSFDVIVSNCVVNLSPNKEAVLREAYRVLKHGGEMFFSDVYSDRRVPKDLVEDPVLFGECLGGALYWNDFITLAKKVGFNDPRLFTDSRITIQNKKVEKAVGNIQFFSATFRLIKLPSLESACEDYGQAVIYKGTVANQPLSFKLDAHHDIATGRVFPVCRNTHMMLYDTRFRRHFDFVGEAKVHFGLFEGCGSRIPFASAAPANGSGTGESCC